MVDGGGAGEWRSVAVLTEVEQRAWDCIGGVVSSVEVGWMDIGDVDQSSIESKCEGGKSAAGCFFELAGVSKLRTGQKNDALAF